MHVATRRLQVQSDRCACCGPWIFGLRWDEQANGKDILFLYGKRGMQYWYHAALSNFDASTLDHTMTPFNGDRALIVNLLQCKKSVIKEWRFVQEGEDEQDSLGKLNSED